MKPILQALLVADHVYEDKATGKKIVAGVFRNLFFHNREDLKAELERKGLPGNAVVGGLDAGSPYAYVSLTDLRGTQQFVLRFVCLDEDNVLFEANMEVSCGDPLEPVEIIAPLPRLPVNKAGIYALELLWNDEPLGSFRVTVKKMQIGGPPDDIASR